jgi:hypothetical protein
MQNYNKLLQNWILRGTPTMPTGVRKRDFSPLLTILRGIQGAFQTDSRFALLAERICFSAFTKAYKQAPLNPVGSRP